MLAEILSGSSPSDSIDFRIELSNKAAASDKKIVFLRGTYVIGTPKPISVRFFGRGKSSGFVSAEYQAISPRNDMSSSLWSTSSSFAIRSAHSTSLL